MTRSTKAEKARQLNAAYAMLLGKVPLPEAMQRLSREFDLSERSGIPVSGRSDPSGRAGRSLRDYGTDYAQASGGHGTYSASLCEEQWADDRRDRDTCVGHVSKYSEKAWLSRAKGTALSKFTLTICLIACTTRSSRRPTVFWCRFGSVRLATV